MQLGEEINGTKGAKQLQNKKTNIEHKTACLSQLINRGRRCRSNRKIFKVHGLYIFYTEISRFQKPVDREMNIKNKKLCTKIYRKQTNRQNFLDLDSEHPKSLKNRIPYSQTLKNKRISTTSKDLKCHNKEFKQQFLEQEYNSELLHKQIKTIEKLDRNELIKGKKKGTQIAACISLVITYNQFSPNVSTIIRQNWNILSVNESLKQISQNQPVSDYKCNKSLKELIGSKKVENNIVEKINKSTLKPGKCYPCFGSSTNLYCNQVTTTSTFKSQQTQKNK